MVPGTSGRTLGWSLLMWGYLLFRAIFIDHQNDDQYSQFPYLFRD